MAVSVIKASDLIQYSSTGKRAVSAVGLDAGHATLRQPSDTTQISGVGQIRAAFGRLQSAASELSDPAAFSTLVATSSNPSVVNANLTQSKLSASSDVEVLRLASAQRVVTLPQASPDSVIGSGEKTTLSIQFGVSSGTKFTADNVRKVETVTIDARNNTLKGIAAEVNAADVGVIAAVTFNGTSFQLQFSANESGAENSFIVSAAGDDVLEKNLTYTPDKILQAVTQTVAAQDAQIKVNGVTLETRSNTVPDVIPGVTLELKSVGRAQVAAGENSENVVARKVDNFIAAFNQLQAQLKQTDVGQASDSSVVRDIKIRVNEALEAAKRNAGAFGGLDGIGIRSDAAGNLQLDTSTFQTSLRAQRDAVTKIFANGGQGFTDLIAVAAQNLSKLASREVSRVSEAVRTEQTRLAELVSGSRLQANGFEGQYSQLRGLVQSVDRTDQTLHGLLLQLEAAQSSQSSLLNRLNSIANLMTP